MERECQEASTLLPSHSILLSTKMHVEFRIVSLKWENLFFSIEKLVSFGLKSGIKNCFIDIEFFI